jgi:hypothetical protein
MNRRDILKALAALPFVGKLVTNKRRGDVRKDEPLARSQPNASALRPSLLPAVCPLCEKPWNHKAALDWGPSATGAVPRDLVGAQRDGRGHLIQECYHIDNPTHTFTIRELYAPQLRRRREMEEDAIYDGPMKKMEFGGYMSWNDDAHAKIRDIDAVLRFLGETP